MGIEKQDVEIAKQLDDVGALLVELMKVIKKKEPISEVVDELVAAIEGVGEISSEFQENQVAAIKTISARAGEMIAVLIEK